ncbi:MAG TPA: hypothetical protein VK425_09935 [Acidimicrobiales bacterium]|nr:hypothetical protein [Acidimicrobiales bacterium]
MAPPPSSSGRVIMRGLADPVVWLGPRGLYVITPSDNAPGEETVRLVEPSTGKLEATDRLPGLLVSWPHMVLSPGELWLTTQARTGKTSWVYDLVALGAGDLRLRHRVDLGEPAELGLAAAGGWVWVETTHYLAKVAPATGKVVGTVPLPATDTGDLASDQSGKTLVSVHWGDVLDLLNPSTGRTTASYQGVQGDGGYVAGVADGQVFVSSGIGHESSYQRFDTYGRKFYTIYGWGYGPDIVVSGNRFLYNVYTGYKAPVTAPNYCGATATGQPLAALPAAATPPRGKAVGYAAGTLYYLNTGAALDDLERTALAGCR